MVAKVLKDVIEQAETWPQQDQEELAEYAREIQARRTGVYIMAEPPLNIIIRVDRSVRPVYPEWVKKVMHPELEGTGPAEYDLAKVEQWFHDEQKKGVVVGNRIYEHLKSNNMLDSCLGLRDLEEIQKKGVTFFRKPINAKAVFGWKSVVLGDGGNLSVPCLVGFGAGVVLDWYWLNHDWSDDRPALRFAS
jgi:hypothetical protein